MTDEFYAEKCEQFVADFECPVTHLAAEKFKKVSSSIDNLEFKSSKSKKKQKIDNEVQAPPDVSLPTVIVEDLSLRYVMDDSEPSIDAGVPYVYRNDRKDLHNAYRFVILLQAR